MKPIALIIEDDPDIRAALADRLESMGHDFHAVGSQQEARERFKRCTYDYVLLDLEVPTRIGRPPSIQFGKNILGEIQDDSRHAGTAVIVVTAHGHDSPGLAVELMKLGATDFVNKPFRNLDDKIREALGRKEANGSANQSPVMGDVEPRPLRPLAEVELTFFEDRAELAGVEICNIDNGVIWRILAILTRTRPNGQPMGFAGKAIANELGIQRGQNAVADAVSHFRRRTIKTMSEAGFHTESDSIIVSGRSGYQLHVDLVVRTRTKPPEERDAEDETLGGDERQEWVLDQLAEGTKLRRIDIERHFSKSTATVKRDLKALDDRIEFQGSGPNGYWRLRQVMSRAD